MKRLIVTAALAATSLFGAINLDNLKAEVHLKNNRANILLFPFIVDDSKLAAADDNFIIKAKNNTVAVIPTGTDKDQADLLVWSPENKAFIVTLYTDGKDQVFQFTYNGVTGHKNAATARFETGAIENDIKSLIKNVRLKQNIPGYTKVKIKRQFKTKSMLMQKDYIYDGAKYRVEEWYIKNITKRTLFLDEATFYTKGIIAINFDQRELRPRETTKMVLIINKASLEDQGGK